MSLVFLAWLVLHDSFCTKSDRQGSVAPKPRRTINEQCAFCQGFSSNREAFDIVWEDADFFAFRDRIPASLHHIQLIPKVHITSVKKLTKRDVDMVRRMESIGNDILDNLQVPPTHRRMGFHIPPVYSVQHLHMHVQALPYISCLRQLKYPVARGSAPFDKGLSWFVDVEQTIRILDKGSTVGILPC